VIHTAATVLNIAPGLTLPIDAASARFVILGKSGAGKTSGDAVLIEEFVGAGVPTVVLDPLGKMWGLRSSRDGETAGLRMAILGGEHGDVPLRSDRGAYVADMLAEGVSAVLDLSQLTHDDQCIFVADFLPRLIKRARMNMHVAIEEAETFAPERAVSKPHARARAAATVFARTARNHGIGWTFSTQKAQILAKDVIDSSDAFIAMKMTGELAQAAIGAEVRSRAGKTLAEKIMGELPGLPRGHAWFIPDADWLGDAAAGPAEPTPFHFRWRNTFEVRAPRVGEERRAPRVLAPVDLEQLREAMAADSIEGDDVEALKAKIADLQEQLKAAGGAGAASINSEALAAAVAEAEHRGRLLGRQDMLAAQRGAAEALEAAQRHTGEALALLQSEPIAVPEPVQRHAAAAPEARQSRAGPAPIGPGAPMPRAERLVLTALAQYPAGRSKTQVAILTGYSSSGGGFNNAIGALRSKGWLEGGGELMQSTQAGLKALGQFTPLPRGRELLQHWMGQVGKAERLILAALADAYPRTRTKEQVAEAAGYEPSGGGFNNALSRLRTLELISGGAHALRASEELFG